MRCPDKEGCDFVSIISSFVRLRYDVVSESEANLSQQLSLPSLFEVILKRAQAITVGLPPNVSEFNPATTYGYDKCRDKFKYPSKHNCNSLRCQQQYTPHKFNSTHIFINERSITILG